MHEIFNETNRDEVIGDVIAFIGSAVGSRRQ
jgi:alpha-beta hydrolase superfamily lysophospholipase